MNTGLSTSAVRNSFLIAVLSDASPFNTNVCQFLFMLHSHVIFFQLIEILPVLLRISIAAGYQMFYRNQIYVYLYLCPSLYIYISLSVSISLTLSSLSIYLYVYNCTFSISVSIISLPMYLYCYFSIILYVYVSTSTSVSQSIFVIFPLSVTKTYKDI